MSRSKALEILGLSDPISQLELRKRYRLKALKYHPDKAPQSDSQMFIQVHQAYEYLRVEIEEGVPSGESNSYDGYESYMARCLSTFGVNVTKDQISDIMSLVQNRCISMACQRLGIDTLIRVYSFLFEMRTFIGVSESTLAALEAIVQDRIRDENVILIHPTLRHLLEKEVYVLKHNGETWYVPLWEPESEIESKDGNIHIRCVPAIDDKYWIGDDNKLHVEVEAILSEVFSNEHLMVELEGREFVIPASKLRLTKTQTYIEVGCGIPKPSMDHSKKEVLSDIVFHITLTS